jgi:RecB family exonuclease
MILPESAVGPTDIQAYRDCPRRFAFGMRRHTEAGEHPEAQGPSTAYGSAVHRALEIAESSDATDVEAVQAAFDEYAKWLDPPDLERLRTDLRTYRERDYLGVRTVAVETELRMPLFEHDGQMIHLRTRIDRLYQRLDNPAVFIHVDYKSSRWPKSQQEVDEDRQLWLTNLIVHEVYPECETLVQAYDQLNYGVLTTRKSEAQRGLVRDWAIHQITTILGDDELPAKKNRWCPWCPIMESCPIVPELTAYALAEVATLAPPEKVGRKTVLNLDPDLYEVYVEALEDVNLAQKVLKRFDDSVRGVVKELPDARQRELGFETRPRTRTNWPPEALRAAHEVLGEDFYEVVGLTKTAVQRLGDERADIVLDMAVIEDGAPVVQRR